MTEAGKEALKKARDNLFDMQMHFGDNALTGAARALQWQQLREVETFLAMLARGDFEEKK